ncbi:MAG: hypothetical protein PUC65_14470 [Clostridiales bacterium]|nr:hypothetical protein [Clostridiales bacterium]
MIKYKIADLVIELECEKELLPEGLKEFQWLGLEQADLQWRLQDQQIPEIPDGIEWIDFSGFSVGRYQNKVIVSYSEEDIYLIRWIVYEDNFSKAVFYYNKGSFHSLSDQRKEELSTYLFYFYREAFFLGVLYQDGISIHSASLIYREKGIVFSALSQTGKSTHTNRWKQMYGTPILDGDVTVCRYFNDKLYIYGLPWSGTSELFLNQRVELEALVFLHQGPENKVSQINVYHTFQQLFSRSFTPLWDSILMEQRVRVTERIVPIIPQVYSLECLPNQEAVEVIKTVIDENFS